PAVRITPFNVCGACTVSDTPSRSWSTIWTVAAPNATTGLSPCSTRICHVPGAILSTSNEPSDFRNPPLLFPPTFGVGDTETRGVIHGPGPGNNGIPSNPDTLPRMR